MKFAERHPLYGAACFSAADLAKLVVEGELPNLPGTAKGWTLRAEREGWPWRKRAGRGGGKEYPISCLPGILKGQSLTNAVKPNDRLVTVAEILSCADQFARQHNMPVGKTLTSFVSIYNRGDVLVREATRATFPTLSVQTLRRWFAARKRGEIMRLFSNGKRGRGSSISEQHQQAILGLIRQHTNITARQIHDNLQEAYADAPSLRVVQRFIKWLKENDKKTYLALTNPDGFKNHYAPAFGRGDALATHANAEWQLDSTTADVFDDTGKRLAIIGVVDVFSRRAKYLVAEHSSAAGIKALLRDSILDWGVPAMLRMDNGKDYASKEIEILCGLLGIERKFCTPYSPEQKGYVERMFNTMTTQLWATTKGYSGRNVVEAQKIRAQKSMAQRAEDNTIITTGLSHDEIQTRLDDWVEGYHNRPHSSLEGLTPNEKARRDQKIRRIPDVRILDVLLTDLAVADGKRKVLKKGLMINRIIYNSEELGDYIDHKVIVKGDPKDAGTIWVYSLDGEYLCKAINTALHGVSERDIALAAKQRSRAFVRQASDRAQQGLKDLKRARRHNHARDIKRDIAESSGIVVPLVPKEVMHNAAAINAVDKAINDSVSEMTANEMYTRWQQIDAALKADEAVSEEDRRWYKTYQNHSEFQVRAGNMGW